MLVSIVAVAAMQFVVIKLIASMDSAPILALISEQLPEPFKAMVSEPFLAGLSIKGAAAFGFNHPVVIVLLAITAINIPINHISGEMETGTLELLLAHPIRRTELLFSLWISGCAVLFLVVCGAWAGSYTALALSGSLTQHLFGQMLKIGSNLWLLMVLIMSFTLLAATFGKVGNRLGAQIAVGALLFYFLNFLSTSWEAIGFIRPFNPFTYYQPVDLMFDRRSFGLNVVVLTVASAVCLLVSLWQFKRRDIPS